MYVNNIPYYSNLFNNVYFFCCIFHDKAQICFIYRMFLRFRYSQTFHFQALACYYGQVSNGSIRHWKIHTPYLFTALTFKNLKTPDFDTFSGILKEASNSEIIFQSLEWHRNVKDYFVKLLKYRQH